MAMDLAGRIIGAESGGNSLARNPRSSAAGSGQFLSKTWLDTIRKHRPDVATGKSDAQILQLRFDPSLSKAMTDAYASDNQGFLKSRGIDPTPGNTYLAHFAGPQGAAAIHGNPSASAEQLLGARAVAANPFLRGKTGADVINWASGKVGDAPSTNQATNGAPMATPIGGAPIAGGPVPLQQPNKRYSKLADMLMAQAAGAKVSGWGDALRAAGGAALGYSLGNKADDQETTYRSKLAEALSGASNENLPATLLGSGDDDLMKAGVQMRVAQAKPQATVGRFRPSKQGIVDTVTGQVVPGTENSGSDAAEHGTSAMPYIDKDGNTVYTQLSKAGGRKDIELPEGAKWLPGFEKLDTGTEFVLRDKKSGAVVGTQPKNITGKESQEEVGKMAGQATVALPGAKTMVENAFKTIGELRSHPGLDVATGASNVFDPRSWIPGTNSYDFQAKNKQATGQSFMAARDSLKGAGQVTDFEGAKGEQAIANLDAAQSKEQYLVALENVERMLKASYEDMQRKAGMAGGGAPAPVQQAPQFDINAAKSKYGLE